MTGVQTCALPIFLDLYVRDQATLTQDEQNQQEIAQILFDWITNKKNNGHITIGIDVMSCLSCVLFFHELNWIFDPRNSDPAAQMLQNNLKVKGLKDSQGDYLQIYVDFFSGVSESYDIFSLENYWWWAKQLRGKIDPIIFTKIFNFDPNSPFARLTLWDLLGWINMKRIIS